MGADPALQAGLFRAGRSEWDLRTTVGYGASKTVQEEPDVRLRSYNPFDPVVRNGPKSGPKRSTEAIEVEAAA
jgi:hypothetical protein